MSRSQVSPDRVRILSFMHLLTWLVVLAFLAWAIRLEFLEGYLYALPDDFPGDFKNAVNLEFWTGQGLFYGPIFVLEWRLLLHPGIVHLRDLAHVDIVLFGFAFVCTWVALFDGWRPRLLLLVLAAWLANHATVAFFASAQHLEALELALFALAALLLTRDRGAAAGLALGAAIATKVLPVVFLPYLVVARQWRALASAIVLAGAVFLATCFYQQISPWDGLVELVQQGPNLTKTKATAEEYALRAYFIRLQTGSGDAAPTPGQAQNAFVLHAAISALVLALTAYLLWRVPMRGRRVLLAFGLIEATMLVVSPSSHIHYFVFLLPAWTAVLAELFNSTRGPRSIALGLMLGLSYVLVGFDEPFVWSTRLLGVGQDILLHWVDLNPFGLALAVCALVLSLWPYRSSGPHAASWLHRHDRRQPHFQPIYRS